MGLSVVVWPAVVTSSIPLDGGPGCGTRWRVGSRRPTWLTTESTNSRNLAGLLKDRTRISSLPIIFLAFLSMIEARIIGLVRLLFISGRLISFLYRVIEREIRASRDSLLCVAVTVLTLLTKLTVLFLP